MDTAAWPVASRSTPMLALNPVSFAPVIGVAVNTPGLELTGCDWSVPLFTSVSSAVVKSVIMFFSVDTPDNCAVSLSDRAVIAAFLAANCA